MLPTTIIFIYLVTYVSSMKIETHEKSLEEHKRIIFKWALEVEGLEKSQRTIGLHASRAALDLLSILLHKKKLVDEGYQLNHRWFKSNKVFSKLPNFDNKIQIVSKIVELENLCEKLSYGAEKPVTNTEKAIELLKEIEEMLRKLI